MQSGVIQNRQHDCRDRLCFPKISRTERSSIQIAPGNDTLRWYPQRWYPIYIIALYLLTTTPVFHGYYFNRVGGIVRTQDQVTVRGFDIPNHAGLILTYGVHVTFAPAVGS